MTQNELYIYLVKCAINEQKPESPVPLDMKEIWAFAVVQSLAATIAKPLLDHNLITDGKWYGIWSEALYKSVRKTMYFDEERKIIESAFDEAKIWHAPLKGIIVNHLYPFYGMREFADNDILVEDGRQEDISRIMEAMGYYPEDHSQEVHLCFHKDPILNFEIHHRLFRDKRRLDALNEYYSDVKSKLIRDGSSEYSFRFGDDDFYVYILAHAYKHYTGSGMGIRQLSDIYLYRKTVKMDDAYVAGELNKLGISEFSVTVEALSNKMFSPNAVFREAELTDDERIIYEGAVSQGVYGGIDQYYETEYTDYIEASDGGGKVKYFWHRVFPDIEDYKNRNPVFYRHKILRPVFYVYRPIHGFISNRKSLIKEFNAVSKYKDNNRKSNQ